MFLRLVLGHAGRSEIAERPLRIPEMWETSLAWFLWSSPWGAQAPTKSNINKIASYIAGGTEISFGQKINIMEIIYT